jgi:hypothetical protein
MTIPRKPAGADILRRAYTPPMIAVAPDERWCIGCGETYGGNLRRCPRCGCREHVEPADVLKPGEYRIAT